MEKPPITAAQLIHSRKRFHEVGVVDRPLLERLATTIDRQSGLDCEGPDISLDDLRVMFHSLREKFGSSKATLSSSPAPDVAG